MMMVKLFMKLHMWSQVTIEGKGSGEPEEMSIFVYKRVMTTTSDEPDVVYSWELGGDVVMSGRKVVRH